jgi:hypothetical protein
VPDAESDSLTAKREPGERCGRCHGAISAGDAELCPHCGALLAAYRTAETVALPAAPDPVQTEIVIPHREARDVTEPASQPRASEPTEELKTARAELLAALLAPERQMLSVVEAASNVNEATPSPIVEPGPVPPPTHAAKSAAKSVNIAKEPKPVKVHQTTFRVRTNRRGFVPSGPVEPVLLGGAVIFALAIVLLICASVASLRSVAYIAFFFGSIGIFVILIAVLAVLVQRDRRRE